MVTIRVSVRSVPGAEIDPAKVRLRVLFFDLVNGRRIARGLHEGEYPQHLVTEPIDWKDEPPEEIIDFVYFRPYTQDQETGQKRQYYGFIAELFYDDEWQDRVIHPRTLVVEMESSGNFAPPLGQDRDPSGSRGREFSLSQAVICGFISAKISTNNTPWLTRIHRR